MDKQKPKKNNIIQGNQDSDLMRFGHTVNLSKEKIKNK
jgi:hypothetical protein